jgi:REP-associated tyrosine transposase
LTLVLLLQLVLAFRALAAAISTSTCPSSQTKLSPFGCNNDMTVTGDEQQRPPRTPLERIYDYRRKLPHYQPAGRRLFITFRKNDRAAFPPEARDAVLRHCLYDHGRRYQLHAAVIMPDHVHILLTPLRDQKGWPHGLPAILKQLKGTSARSVNKLSSSGGPVWQEESFDHVLRSSESFAEKLEYIRQNPVRRGLVKSPEDYPWLWVEPAECDKDRTDTCGTDTPVRRL